MGILSLKLTPSNSLVKTVFFTGLALIAFAANSILCRLALGGNAIDASSFTIIRLLSGTLVLLLLVALKGNSNNTSSTKGSWSASFMLFLYATTFSFAYLKLDTGTGALILFGSVQITMILLSVFSGNRLHFSEWAGVIISFMGFSYLILPTITTPSVTGFLLMATSGIAWAIYTLKGRKSNNSLSDTTYNFLRTIPLVIALITITIKDAHYSTEGVVLAVLSGSLASGIGYALWYSALRGLSITQATVVQLLVPVIAVLGGIVFVSETITARFTISASMILGGILMVILGSRYLKQ
tara:strand:+ start:7842 stop:8732 length:891 start_codon:yes stop_codon:yes gene_type:complete